MPSTGPIEAVLNSGRGFGDFVLSVKRTSDDDYEEDDDLKVTGGSHDIQLRVPL